MPKTLTISDARLAREIRITLDEIGVPVRAIVYGEELDSTGNVVAAFHADIDLTDTSLTFSGLFGGGSAPGNVVKDGAGQARAAKDRVQDHTADLISALQARVKTLRGI